MLGTGITQPDAKTGKINHAWNKVKLDGKWYNMDVCWADTANTSDYDLKTDAEYLALPNKHWPTYFGNGPYAAKCQNIEKIFSKGRKSRELEK